MNYFTEGSDSVVVTLHELLHLYCDQKFGSLQFPGLEKADSRYHGACICWIEFCCLMMMSFYHLQPQGMCGTASEMLQEQRSRCSLHAYCQERERPDVIAPIQRLTR